MEQCRFQGIRHRVLFHRSGIILKDSQAWETVDWLARGPSALTFWGSGWFSLFFFSLNEVIISKWNCRLQSFLLGGVDGDSWLFILGRKPGDLCFSSGSSRVTSGRLISSSSLSSCIYKRRAWANSPLWVRNAWRRRSEWQRCWWAPTLPLAIGIHDGYVVLYSWCELRGSSPMLLGKGMKC